MNEWMYIIHVLKGSLKALTVSEQESLQTCKNKIQLRKKKNHQVTNQEVNKNTEGRQTYFSSLASLKQWL